MPAPANVDEFIDIIQKSGVTDNARFQAYLQRLTEGSGVPRETNTFAKTLIRDGQLTFFQAEQLLLGKWKRFFIGKYKVLERLGAGGMGQVFLCEHKMMRRRVAVKVLPTTKASDPASLDRFYREARAVAAVDHPNIVRAYDIDQDDNLHFLVMEFVDGTNLHDLVKKFGVLDPIRAAHYIYGSAVGLQHAHEMGLVHRDIKPGNILIDRTGIVKILDMGLARFFDPDEDDLLTKKYDENILGTADYLAPEQAVDSHTVDIRADIYSLGCTFYYLLTGQSPFPEGSVAQKLLWHQTREPASILSLRPNVPPDLVAVIEKMMTKTSETRYQTPSELMAALEPWVQTPIPPPSDRELPQFSLAAVGTPAGQNTSKVISDSPTTGPKSPSPGSGAKTLAQAVPKSDRHRIGGTVRGPQGSSFANAALPKPAGWNDTTTPGSGLPVQAPYPPAPVPVPEPATQGVSELWEELANTGETTTNFQGDTDPNGKADREAKPKSSRLPKPATTPRNRTLLFVALGGGFLLMMGATLAAGLYLFVFTGKTVVNPDSAKKWYVTGSGDSPNPDRTLTTLRGAWDQVKSDETIVILDDKLNEPGFRLNDHEKKKKNVRIEPGSPSHRVTWVPKGRSLTMLEISSVEGLSIRGIDFDLGMNSESAITISRYCPGLLIEDVTISNPTVAGVRFGIVNATTDQPVTVRKTRISGKEKYLAAITFFTGNQYVRIDDCRLEGPADAAVKIEGTVTETSIRNCRVYNFDRGIWLSGNHPKPEVPLSLTVENNTFHTMRVGGIVSEFPLKDANKHLDLSRNYFAACKVVVETSFPALPNLKLRENARDAATKEGKVNTKATVVDHVFPAPDPANDANFLRAPAGGPLSHVGAEKVSVGAPPR